MPSAKRDTTTPPAVPSWNSHLSKIPAAVMAPCILMSRPPANACLLFSLLSSKLVSFIPSSTQANLPGRFKQCFSTCVIPCDTCTWCALYACALSAACFAHHMSPMFTDRCNKSRTKSSDVQGFGTFNYVRTISSVNDVPQDEYRTYW